MSSLTNGIGTLLKSNPVGTALGAGAVGIGVGAGSVALLGSKTKKEVNEHLKIKEELLILNADGSKTENEEVNKNGKSLIGEEKE